MNTAARLGVFGIALAAIFGAAAAVGAAVDPIDVGGTAEHADHSAVSDGGAASDMNPTGQVPRGLSVAADGFRLVIDAAPTAADTASTLAFRIVGEDGSSVTTFDDLHERRLHLIVVSRNLVDYLHVHPTMADTGEWTVDLPPLPAGSYRVFADAQPTGADNITLGTDLLLPGDVAPVAVPPVRATDEVDGITVALSGAPTVGDTELSFAVSVDGAAVETEPYLGAAGHLVAIRSGDLAYLHVHPDDSASGPAVTFTAEFPTAGTYRLFLDFSLDGVVRTASFTVEVAPPAGIAGTDTTVPAAADHEGH